jgi:hypothetical protein
MSSSTDKQGKTELNISSHQQKDKDKSGDYAMHGSDYDKDKNKHEKTSITFERKKCDDKSCQDKGHEHSWNKDKDLSKDKKEFHYENKDLNKDKDWNKDKDMHDKEENKGGIINTIKEKVKDVLGSGDNDKIKEKEKDKDVHMSSTDYNKNRDVNEKFGSSTVGVTGTSSSSSAYPSSNLGATSGSSSYHTSNLGASSGSSNLGSSNLGSSNLGASHLSSEKQFSSGTTGVGAGYSGVGQATVDHKNLGAEHREVGYDKQSNVIPSKEKDKDAVHKVDVHGSLYTSGAGTTFEAK